MAYVQPLPPPAPYTTLYDTDEDGNLIEVQFVEEKYLPGRRHPYWNCILHDKNDRPYIVTVPSHRYAHTKREALDRFRAGLEQQLEETKQIAKRISLAKKELAARLTVVSDTIASLAE